MLSRQQSHYSVHLAEKFSVKILEEMLWGVFPFKTRRLLVRGSGTVGDLMALPDQLRDHVCDGDMALLNLSQI